MEGIGSSGKRTTGNNATLTALENNESKVERHAY